MVNDNGEYETYVQTTTLKQSPLVIPFTIRDVFMLADILNISLITITIYIAEAFTLLNDQSWPFFFPYFVQYLREDFR